MTLHPQRCEACDKFEKAQDGYIPLGYCHINEKTTTYLYAGELRIISSHGCASHSSKTPAPASPQASIFIDGELQAIVTTESEAATIRNQTLDEIIQWSSQYANKKFTAGMLGEYIASLRTQSTQEPPK